MAFIRLRLGSVRRTDGNTCKMRHQGDRLHRGNGGADHRDTGLLLALLLQGAAERTGQRGSAGGQTQHPHKSILLMDSVWRKTLLLRGASGHRGGVRGGCSRPAHIEQVTAIQMTLRTKYNVQIKCPHITYMRVSLLGSIIYGK